MKMAVQQKSRSPQDMLLLCMTVSCVLFGSSAYRTNENKCIGSTLKFSELYSPPSFKGKMYFTPNGGGSGRLIMDKGEAKDPRLTLSYSSAELRDLTRRDEGTFSVSLSDSVVLDVIRLNILVCSDKVTEYYGASYTGVVPSETVFLEFTRLHSKNQPKVIWRLTDPQNFIRGRVRLSDNTWEMNDLTQSDNGNYSFRAKDNTLLKRIQLEVKEHVIHYNAEAMEQIFLENHFGGSLWSVTFTRKGDEGDFSLPLIVRGKLVKYRYAFDRRLWLDDGGIQIDDLESGDSGTFQFKDQQGNLAQIVELEVEDDMEEEVPTAVIIGMVAVIVFLIFACCCCVRKCCCKKSSSQRDESTLPVYNHDSTQPAGPSYSAAPAPHHSYQPINSRVPKEPTATSLKPSDSTQPAGPSYSAAPAPHHSYQPINSRVPKEPTATSLKPSVHNPVNIHVNPPQPEVAPLGGQRTDPTPTVGFDCLSSDAGPQFELKGPTFLTAPLVSSDPTFSDVYSSDKFNFKY